MTAAISPRLSHFVTENPQEIAIAYGRKATLCSLASKVCIAAFLAIATVVLSISIGLISPLPSALTLALILGTLPLQLGFQSFMIQSFESSEISRQATDRANELTRLRHWTNSQIMTFFKEHALSIDKLPMDLLRQLNPKEPLKALLPAIASYNYLCHKAQKHFQEHQNNLHNNNDNRILRYQGRRIGWKKLESEAIPAALQAALLLQTISQPTLHLKLDDLGFCQAKEFDQRRFDQLLDGSDDYFVFKDGKRPPLTFSAAQEMVSKQDFDGLRIKLFSKENGPHPALRQ